MIPTPEERRRHQRRDTVDSVVVILSGYLLGLAAGVLIWVYVDWFTR